MLTVFPAMLLPTSGPLQCNSLSPGTLLLPLCACVTSCFPVSPPQEALHALLITSNSPKRTHSTMSSFVVLVTTEIAMSARLPQHLWVRSVLSYFCIPSIYPSARHTVGGYTISSILLVD